MNKPVSQTWKAAIMLPKSAEVAVNQHGVARQTMDSTDTCLETASDENNDFDRNCGTFRCAVI